MNEKSFPGAACDLDLIATHSFDLSDGDRFLARYAPAVRRYLEALLKNAQDAEDVAQSFFLRVVEGGLRRFDPARGRFRDYLKVGVRNAALSFLRQKSRQPRVIDGAMIPEAFSQREPDANRAWLREWQQCLLERVWQALERHERFAEGNLFHTVLRASVDHPDEDSSELAVRVSCETGRPLSAEAFRKQLSRARQAFAKLIVREVELTLKQPSPADVEDELTETGLLAFVQRFSTSE